MRARSLLALGSLIFSREKVLEGIGIMFLMSRGIMLRFHEEGRGGKEMKCGGEVMGEKGRRMRLRR